MNELEKSDAAIVLGAAVYNGTPSPVLRERVNHAIWLYENEYVEKIIFTGGKSREDSLTESEAAKEYANSKKVASGDILIEVNSKITEENLLYALEVAEANKLNTFILVSDPLHMKRTTMIAEDFGMDVRSSPTQTSAYKTYKTKIPFFFRELFFLIAYRVTLPFR
ncbi:YdcF family protein [Sutcliffiella sp. NPDC057660]|uniref:YdcF family protein n=1 Tax=Sutcliffiella sp. NPDC057660 TaxID=3346199 RepID=UPI0036B3FFF1